MKCAIARTSSHWILAVATMVFGCRPTVPASSSEPLVPKTDPAPAVSQTQLGAPSAPREVAREALGNPELVGQRISVTAQVDWTPRMCTEEVCSPSEPCCNECSGVFTIGAVGLLGPGIPSCLGNGCSVDASCPMQPGVYRAVGTLEKGPWQTNLRVESIAP